MSICSRCSSPLAEASGLAQALAEVRGLCKGCAADAGILGCEVLDARSAKRVLSKFPGAIQVRTISYATRLGRVRARVGRAARRVKDAELELVAAIRASHLLTKGRRTGVNAALNARLLPARRTSPD